MKIIFSILLILSISNAKLLKELKTDKREDILKYEHKISDNEFEKGNYKKSFEIMGSAFHYAAGAKEFDYGNHKKAYDILISLAKSGNRYAQYKIGQIYQKGLGKTRDLEKATYWFKLSAEQNYFVAQNELNRKKVSNIKEISMDIFKDRIRNSKSGYKINFKIDKKSNDRNYFTTLLLCHDNTYKLYDDNGYNKTVENDFMAYDTQLLMYNQGTYANMEIISYDGKIQLKKQYSGYFYDGVKILITNIEKADCN